MRPNILWISVISGLLASCSGSDESPQRYLTGNTNPPPLPRPTPSNLCAESENPQEPAASKLYCLDAASCGNQTHCQASASYIQDAIDFASQASRDANSLVHVELSPGTHLLQHVKTIQSEATRKVYLTVPEGVVLKGAANASLQVPSCEGSCTPIDTAIYIGPFTAQGLGGGLKDLRLGTSTPSCNWETRALPLAAVVGETAQTDRVVLERLKIQNFKTGIEVGSFIPWTPDALSESALQSPNSVCHSGFTCTAKKTFFSGANDSLRLKIQYNEICGVDKGIAVIGNYVDVLGNVIQMRPPEEIGNVPTGFGISAAFAGNHHVRVLANTIRGGLVGILTDGSYPLLYTSLLFQNYWSQILEGIRAANSETYANEFAERYPQAPLTQGQLDFGGRIDDYLRAGQVLLDLASKAAVQSNNGERQQMGMPYDIVIENNDVLETIRALVLYRSQFAHLYGNRLFGHERSSMSDTGITLNHTSNSFVAENNIRNFDVGIHLTGVPQTLSVLGSSYTGIGVKWLRESNEFPEVGNLIQNVNLGIYVGSANPRQPQALAGYNISVRKNILNVLSARACNLVGASSTRPDIDWFTENLATSANGIDQTCN